METIDQPARGSDEAGRPLWFGDTPRLGRHAAHDRPERGARRRRDIAAAGLDWRVEQHPLEAVIGREYQALRMPVPRYVAHRPQRHARGARRRRQGVRAAVVAEAALSAADEAVLGDLVAGYRSRTRAEVIDAIEPTRVMRRKQHRHAAVRICRRCPPVPAGRCRRVLRRLPWTSFASREIHISRSRRLLFYGPRRAIAVQRAATSQAH